MALRDVIIRKLGQHKLRVFLAAVAGITLLACYPWSWEPGGSESGSAQKASSRESVNCEMTYMWRSIYFMDVGFIDRNDRYSLFLYGEGSYADNFKNTGVLDGLPIIFVPGHGGSGRQVRSLATILQNKTDGRKSPFHFDSFAVDFNESEYLSHAIDYVWSLYESPPPGIVLVGHSMGGIVAHSLLLDNNFDSSRITLMISLATPYSEPPYLFDREMSAIYDRMNGPDGVRRIISESRFKIVSISGGLKDEFISEEWTKASYVMHASSSALDRVWVEASHNQIVWCNQLMRQVSRVLFDYAANVKAFLQDPLPLLHRHYRAAGRTFSEIGAGETNSSQTNSRIVGTEGCDPRCPAEGLLYLPTGVTGHADFILISISSSTEEELISSSCDDGDEGATRYLTASAVYAVVKFNKDHASACNFTARLNGSSVWLVKQSDITLPPLHLSPIHSARSVSRFRVTSGMKLLPVTFDSHFPSAVYELSIRRDGGKKEGFHRAIFSTANGSDRRVDHGSAILLQMVGEDSLLQFIDDDDTSEYELNSIRLSVSLHYGHSLMKAMRRYRHFLPVSLLLTLTMVTIAVEFNLSTTATLIVMIAGLILKWAPDVSIEFTLVVCAFNFAALASLYAFHSLMFAVFDSRLWSAARNSRLRRMKGVSIAVLIATSLLTHSTLMALALCIPLYYRFRDKFGGGARLFGYLSLVMSAACLQLPSIAVYLWNLVTYGQVRPLDGDAFVYPNFMLLAIYLIYEKPPLMFSSTHSESAFNRSLLSLPHLLFIVYTLCIVHQNALHFHQTFDDLGAVNVCILSASLLLSDLRVQRRIKEE